MKLVEVRLRFTLGSRIRYRLYASGLACYLVRGFGSWRMRHANEPDVGTFNTAASTSLILDDLILNSLSLASERLI